MSKLPVLEVFGPTIQGEGMVVGQKTMFVRTAGCDYSCSWCDSAFTWDGSAKDEIIQMTPEEVWERLNCLAPGNFSHVTVSGGNPALLKNLDGLLDIFEANGVAAALETQGSVWQDWFLRIQDLTLSPKPPSSLMKTNFEVLDDIITRLMDAGRLANMSLKVVIFDDKDFNYAKDVHLRYPAVPFYLQVGNDDTATENNENLTKKLLDKYEWLTDKTAADKDLNNVRVLPQLHTLLWGNKRGV
ncbi:7-carboxy-7-deazaguanine synthase QueE [Salipaludibacillus aurantiacus]|uniref:7-carboxy-7-deazaguanine synthase n=1 Tax=Salipaludibacillus aurantiacus TaxID=1601833 RepID=A0A1H9SA88_9BACI|nr:7-carboxy-7-deazaguanine synthase QueE [Salipaludibacillus aurantiacus]SER81089.1 7-carboxy-7-deazaguanine synthase [Salipaludibacillus aurantiacus]